ncbi:MAG: dehydrogenase E1 component subunit alpha/beta [Rhodospirillaceae bacterium]|nr:dehydrogenase E1 component subunit alpha/beta [Rhodospirillaceae bacterium]
MHVKPDLFARDNAPQPTAAQLRDMLRVMLLIRHFEERVHALYQEGGLKGTAHSSVGQEAIAAGACAALEPKDFILSHHRGHGHCIAKGASVDRMMAELMGKADGYCGGYGGSMHIADFDLNILGANGIVGAAMGLGLGAGLAAQMGKTGQVGIAFFGDGAANEGIFHEAMNMASLLKLPLIFFCENNQYALSTRSADATAGGSIAARGAGYGIPSQVIDGNDAAAVYTAVMMAKDRARAGDGPTLLEAITFRWDDHNMRPSWPRYRTDEEEAKGKSSDPITNGTVALQKLKALTEAEYKVLVNEAKAAIDEAVAFGKASPEPDVSKLDQAVMSPLAPPPASLPAPGARLLSYGEAINEAMAQEMQRDPHVFMMGEDIAKMGGVFGVTRGLGEAFGSRVMDTPISEQAIAGAAVGAALSGYRPIVEIQIFDFVTLMMDMIVNQAAKLRFMLGGKVKVPVVFRGPQGGGVRLAAQHSQSLEAWFAHVPGLVVLAPSNPYDAKGLMAAAIRDDNPCIFLETKTLYLGKGAPVPEESYVIPIGVADIKRAGTDVTVIATLAMVDRALQAADELAKDGISVEVLDPRTLRPLDMDTIIASVKKTSRCLVVHEAWRTGGLGAEIAAEINERAFDWLDAPVTRLGGRDVPTPFNANLERAVVPSAKDIISAVRALMTGAR